MYAKLLARDAAIVAAAVLLWQLGAGYSAGSGAIADFTGVVLGVLLGVCSLFVHEWGHLAGALATRSRVSPAASLKSLFVFSFDSKRNSQRQFLVMTVGGWIGTAAAVAVAYGALPPELLATRVARGLSLVSVALVVATEIPLVTRALWTGRIPPIETRREPPEAQRAAA